MVIAAFVLKFCVISAFLAAVSVQGNDEGCFTSINRYGPKVLFIGDSVDRFAISDWCSFGNEGPIDISVKNKQVGCKTGHKSIQQHLPQCEPFARHTNAANTTVCNLDPEFVEKSVMMCAKKDAIAAFVFNDQGTNLRFVCDQHEHRFFKKKRTDKNSTSVAGVDVHTHRRRRMAEHEQSLIACLSNTLMPMIDAVRQALGGIDGVVIQSYFWDISNRFDEDGHQLATPTGNAEFLSDWERSTSSYLDVILPYLHKINGDGAKAPWVAWRTVNRVDEANDGKHWTSTQAQEQLNVMNPVGVNLARQKKMDDVVPFHIFPGADRRRDRVHPNVKATATMIDYTIRMVQLMHNSDRAKAQPSTPELQLLTMHEAFSNVSKHVDTWLNSLNSGGRSQMKQQLGLETASEGEEKWTAEAHMEWEKHLTMCHKGYYGSDFRSCTRCPAGKTSPFGSSSISGCTPATFARNALN